MKNSSDSVGSLIDILKFNLTNFSKTISEQDTLIRNTPNINSLVNHTQLINLKNTSSEDRVKNSKLKQKLKSGKRDRLLMKSIKQVITERLENYGFTKTQKKLMFALMSFEPMAISELKIKTGSSSIISLVRDTNKKWQRNHCKETKIISCYRDLKKKNHYRLIYLPYFL